MKNLILLLVIIIISVVHCFSKNDQSQKDGKKNKSTDNLLIESKSDIKDVLNDKNQSLEEKIKYAWSVRFIKITIIHDINNDGVNETIESLYGGGSGGYDIEVTLTNGKTGEKYKVINGAWYSYFCFLKGIPSELFIDKNKPFLELYKNFFYLKNKRKKPEGSLKWLIDKYLNTHTVKSELFSKVFYFEPTWEKGKPKITKPYYILVEKELYKNLSESLAGIIVSGKENKTINRGWLEYFSNYHKRKFLFRKKGDPAITNHITKEGQNKLYKIFTTAQGVIATKENQFCWVFIGEGVDKFRLSGVWSPRLQDHLVFLLYGNRPESYLYVVDIEKGLCCQFKFDHWSDLRDIDVNEKFLILKTDSIHNDEIELDIIKKEIDKWHRQPIKKNFYFSRQ